MIQQIDYLIIGQGLAGSALAWELTQRGKSVVVYDQPAENRASSIAAGLFNPVTGRVMTKTWMAEFIFPFLKKFYSLAEKSLGTKFFHEVPMYRPFFSMEEKKQWEMKSATSGLKQFVINFREPGAFAHQVNDPFGGIEIAQAGYLDVKEWIRALRDHLKEKNSFHETMFVEEELSAEEGFIQYRNIRAGRVIFCNGLQALNTRWFGWLPLRELKGEVIDVSMESKPERIYNHGVYLVPFVQEHGLRVGATYGHPPFSKSVTVQGREELESKLRALVRLPFEVIHQEWGIRPTTPDRRPILGAHPGNKNVTIFNGLGTKGVSLAPYFAHQMADWLEGHGDLSPEVNINRFKALYSA